jgi:N-acetylglucosamine-6-phosphate deacetylase
MSLKWTLPVLGVLTLVLPGPAAAEGARVVEGMFYLDATPVSITIQDGVIQRVERKDALDDPAMMGVYVGPGLMDHQVNGLLGIGFATEDLTVEKVRRATRRLWEAGVTTYVPTFTTNSRELLERSFAVMAEALQDPEIAQSIPGLHLEGPYISPIDGYRGAHPEEWVRPPDWEEFMAFYRASGEHIIEVTVAPETEGALEFIRRCRKLGIVVAIGHHNASAEVIREAADAGATVSTHLGNGCANTINRHENPLWPQLAEDRLQASLIADGFHLRPEEVKVFHAVKGTERTLIVSDASRLAGMPPGEYERDGATVVVTPEGAVRLPSQNVLAGSASLLVKGVGNVMRFTGCSLAEAFQMTSRNPARLFGLRDRGEIEPGMRADLVFFKMVDGALEIQRTMVRGRTVFSRQ